MPLPEGAIDAGSGQCLDLKIQEADGVVFFFDRWIGFVPDVALIGAPYRWPYANIKAYSLKKGHLLSLLKVDLRVLTIHLGGGLRAGFRIGSMLAANATHILDANGIPSE